MKRLCFAILFLTLSVFSYGQGYLDSLPKLNKGEILMLGENHYVQEVQDVDIEVVKKYASEKDESLVVFIELPYQFNFYVRNLVDHGDSLSLKTYLRLFFPIKTRIYVYNLILSLYKIRLDNPSLQVYCIDRNRSESSVLYTIRDLLHSYPNYSEPIQKIKYQTDSLLQTGIPKSKEGNERFVPHFEKFKKHFRKYKKDYKKTLSTSDFNFLAHLLGNFTESYDIRESIMFRNICKHYQQECKHIAINGYVHTNKEKLQYHKFHIKFNPKTKSLAWQLNNDRKSPFLNKSYSIFIGLDTLISPED